MAERLSLLDKKYWHLQFVTWLQKVYNRPKKDPTQATLPNRRFGKKPPETDAFVVPCEDVACWGDSENGKASGIDRTLAKAQQF